MPAAASPTLVRCVNCAAEHGHSWLDYVAALGGVTGVVISAIALVIAIRSERGAKDAASAAVRTAEAAEKTANAMLAEHEAWEVERSRRPELRARLEMKRAVPAHTEGNRTAFAVVEGGIANSGNRPADAVLVNFLVPDDVQVAMVSDRYGNGLRPMALLETTEPFVPGHPPDRRWVYPNHREDVPPDNSLLTYYRLVFPAGNGRYPLKFKVIHHLAPGGGTIAFRIVEVTDESVSFVNLDDAPEAAGLREVIDRRS